MRSNYGNSPYPFILSVWRYFSGWIVTVFFHSDNINLIAKEILSSNIDLTIAYIELCELCSLQLLLLPEYICCRVAQIYGITIAGGWLLTNGNFAYSTCISN